MTADHPESVPLTDPTSDWLRSTVENAARKKQQETEFNFDTVVDTVMAGVVEEVGIATSATLLSNADAIVANRQAYIAGFKERLREHWGEALDLYLIFYGAVEEVGSTYSNEVQAPEDPIQWSIYNVLLGLHARSCQVAAAVHELLQAGSPAMAHALARTAYELAVTSVVIAENSKGEHADLAQRFMFHQFVQRYKDATVFQEQSAKLGEEPFTDDDMNEFKEHRDKFVSQYGDGYKNENGWAAKLLSKDKPQFIDLEAKADLTHLRPLYKMANHSTHSDSAGWGMNFILYDGDMVRQSGWTNTGLGLPGHWTMGSLLITTRMALTSATSEQRSDDLLAIATLEDMFEKTGAAFERGQTSVDDAEARVQQEQAANNQSDTQSADSPQSSREHL